jgi:phage terminase small subunit
MSTVVELPGAKRRRPRVPPAPPHVAGLAAAEWQRVARVIAERGDLDQAALGVLEAYSIHYGRWRGAEAHVAEFGAVVPAPRTGVPMHNPQLAVANRSADALLKLAKALRITPDTRPRVPDFGGGDAWDSDLLA